MAIGVLAVPFDDAVQYCGLASAPRHDGPRPLTGGRNDRWHDLRRPVRIELVLLTNEARGNAFALSGHMHDVDLVLLTIQIGVPKSPYQLSHLAHPASRVFAFDK